MQKAAPSTGGGGGMWGWDMPPYCFCAGGHFLPSLSAVKTLLIPSWLNVLPSPHPLDPAAG